MSGRSISLVLGSVALMGLLVGTSVRRHSIARADLAASRTVLDTTFAEAQEVLDLRARRPVVAGDRPPTTDVIARINETIESAGLAIRSVSSITPESDTALDRSGDPGDASYRRQSIRLVLDRLTPVQLGRLIAEWKMRQPLWSISRVEMTARGDRRAGSNEFDVSLHLTAVYVTFDRGGEEDPR